MKSNLKKIKKLKKEFPLVRGVVKIGLPLYIVVTVLLELFKEIPASSIWNKFKKIEKVGKRQLRSKKRFIKVILK